MGTGTGVSVKELIDASKRVTGKSVKFEITERREGDPAILFADSRKAQEELGLKPEFIKIDDIISTAWNWDQNRKY